MIGSNRVSAFYTSMLHIPTLMSLEIDKSVLKPNEGKISVGFVPHTPLYCTLAKNATEVKENEAAYREARVDAVVMPECDQSEQEVKWLLLASNEPVTYSGF